MRVGAHCQETGLSAADSAPRSKKSLLRPAIRVTHIKQIDITILQERGIKGIIFDLDDTLVKSFEPTADPDVSRWLAQIQREFAVFIVSNNASDLRVRLASEHLGVMGIAQAGKPSRRSFRKALQLMNLQVHEVAIVGDQLFTDILGGNRLGALTILVDPLSTEVGWHRNLMRAFERYILKRAGVAHQLPLKRTGTTPLASGTASLSRTE